MEVHHGSEDIDDSGCRRFGARPDKSGGCQCRAGAGWKAANFPAPNGGVVVYRIMASGNPACASYDGQNCLWGQDKSQIQFDRLRPLVCGPNHRAQWGVTGYENPAHWCNLAKRVVVMD